MDRLEWLEGGRPAWHMGWMSPELRNALQQLRGGSPPRARANASQLVAGLESRYRIRLPDDFKSYLIEAFDFDGWQGASGILWYPIDRIASLPEVSQEGLPGENAEVRAEADRYLVFADFLDWCGYGYAVCCSEGARRGHVAIVYPPAGRFISRTFTTFVQLAVDDSRRLHSPAGDQFTDIP